MPPDFLLYVVAGFAAQVVDGALGMAYGVTASSLLLSFGMLPAMTSATVHAAECVTTGASALSHHAFANVSGVLFRRLVVPGVIGAVTGAYILATLPGDAVKPFVAIYLIVMGGVIVLKAIRALAPRAVTTRLVPLGFAGALVDAIGGGGWGPIVTGTLLARGNDIRQTVGSVNAVEFFVTGAASVTFVLTLGVTNWPIIGALALGGLLAAPLGAWICTRAPLRPFMLLVGVLVITLSVRTLLRYFGVV